MTPIEYTVKSGDTLSNISQKYNVSVKDISQENNISNPDKIKAGQTIRITKKDNSLEVIPFSFPKVEPPVIDYTSIERDEKIGQAKQELSELAGTLLNADFLQTSVIKKDTENGEQYFLRISRPEDDKNRLNTYSSNKLTMEYIRKHLGVKEGVIQNNNNGKDVADRKNNFPDYATLTMGRHLDIPISELGQESSSWKPWYCSASECEELKAVVKKFEE